MRTKKTQCCSRNRWTSLDVAFSNKAQLRRVISSCERALFPHMTTAEAEDLVWRKREHTTDDMRTEAALKLRQCDCQCVCVHDMPDTPDIVLRRAIIDSDLFAEPRI